MLAGHITAREWTSHEHNAYTHQNEIRRHRGAREPYGADTEPATARKDTCLQDGYPEPCGSGKSTRQSSERTTYWNARSIETHGSSGPHGMRRAKGRKGE